VQDTFSVGDDGELPGAPIVAQTQLDRNTQRRRPTSPPGAPYRLGPSPPQAAGSRAVRVPRGAAACSAACTPPLG
jgi:hypothetical protein